MDTPSRNTLAESKNAANVYKSNHTGSMAAPKSSQRSAEDGEHGGDIRGTNSLQPIRELEFAATMRAQKPRDTATTNDEVPRPEDAFGFSIKTEAAKMGRAPSERVLSNGNAFGSVSQSHDMPVQGPETFSSPPPSAPLSGPGVRDIVEVSRSITVDEEESSIDEVFLEIQSPKPVQSRSRARIGSEAALSQAAQQALRAKVASPTASFAAPHRPSMSSRAASTPSMKAKQASSNGLPPASSTATQPKRFKPVPSSLDTRDVPAESRPKVEDDIEVPALPPSLPLPPLSISAYLHLELSSTKTSPLFIYRSSSGDTPYESSQVKIDRLLNFLRLPPQLELVLWFGALSCLDAWLYTFTILPLRFTKALYALSMSIARNIVAEAKFVVAFIYAGSGRVWRRWARAGANAKEETPKASDKVPVSKSHGSESTKHANFGVDPFVLRDAEQTLRRDSNAQRPSLRHRRRRSAPSNLLPVDKADLLKGCLILSSCYLLMYFDASMMYHSIRGQAAIKLYVIYNVLEVFDRLLSALGQDVLECLLSKETLERKANGRSKIIRPMWLFALALVYNIVHSIALFYQVITLNVAVNSYSNALLTLLMSNQFVEIKGTVFKRFEKENLFQITCADVVERFQLWLMLVIIASRNIIETNSLFGSSAGGAAAAASTATRATGILPYSFTVLPSWAGLIMGPFFFVLGTEAVVDWLKHAYITKFNNIKPNIYGRFLDVLAKDSYSSAFSDPDLTKRLGLPTIPLSCLFIRASVQTYHMFLAMHVPTPLSFSAASMVDYPDPRISPATTAVLEHVDNLIKHAFGLETSFSSAPLFGSAYLPTVDTLLSWGTTIVLFLLVYLVLLVFKILLGMLLLSYARKRYQGMKEREHEASHAGGKRVGVWGVIEVGEDRRRWIYEDDPEGAERLRKRERETREKEAKGVGDKGFGHVERYSMVAKRIW